MKLTEIKEALSKGNTVYWKNENYQVIKDSLGQYLIHSKCNDSYIGLYGKKGTKFENIMNGKEIDFIEVQS